MSPSEEEVQAIMDDLDHAGGVRRYREYLVTYVNDADGEDNWPPTWDEFKKDFALWVVGSRTLEA